MTKSKSILHQQVIDQIAGIGQADILVGIPSFRNETTIVNVVKTVSEGLTKYFPKLKAVIVNSDGGSEDNTQQAVRRTPIPREIDKIITAYQGQSGKGSAFHTIFEIADRLNVRVCIVVDSDLRSITPEWVHLLGDPIYKHNYGFVTPHYFRYKYDGTITNSIAYPLTSALYGQVIRQPIGGDFALSGSLAKIFAHQDIWQTDIAKFGIDIWMTTMAICEGFRICQSSMGIKLHDQKDPGSDIGPMFNEVIGTAFELMKKYEINWHEVKNSNTVEIFGDSAPCEPEPFAVNLGGLLDSFHEGLDNNWEVLSQILAPETLAEIAKLKPVNKEDVFEFPVDIWARAVYDHAVAFNLSQNLEKTQVLGTLQALFFGRTAAFVLATEVMGYVQAEEAVLKTARVFEDQKPYLIKRWDDAVTAAQNDVCA